MSRVIATRRIAKQQRLKLFKEIDFHLAVANASREDMTKKAFVPDILLNAFFVKRICSHFNWCCSEELYAEGHT